MSQERALASIYVTPCLPPARRMLESACLRSKPGKSVHGAAGQRSTPRQSAHSSRAASPAWVPCTARHRCQSQRRRVVGQSAAPRSPHGTRSRPLASALRGRVRSSAWRAARSFAQTRQALLSVCKRPVGRCPHGWATTWILRPAELDTFLSRALHLMLTPWPQRLPRARW